MNDTWDLEYTIKVEQPVDMLVDGEPWCSFNLTAKSWEDLQEFLGKPRRGYNQEDDDEMCYGVHWSQR